MANMDDMELVREYAVGKSDLAFATIVVRHINLVYSAAFRQLGDPQQAEEVTQVVFLILARKAAGLQPGTILSGWLYQTAHFTAANARRAAIRRHRREEEAQRQFMQNHQLDDSWRRLAPVLEEAMSKLGQRERDAIILRYFENRSLDDVAAALRVTQAAAQKRVNRGTEKLRKHFVKRGVPITVSLLVASIGGNALQAAPAGLLSAVSATAARSAALSAQTAGLAKSTMNVMTWTKIKMATLVCTATFAATGTATVAIEASAISGFSHVEFEAEGFMRYSIRNPPTDVLQPVYIYRFKLSVRDQKWRLFRERDDKVFSVDTGYDGEELLRSINNDNVKPELTAQGKPIITSAGTAEVQYSPVPTEMMELPIWFAYASGSYLDATPPGHLPPIELNGQLAGIPATFLRSGYQQKAELTRYNLPPGLPERAVTFCDGQFFPHRGGAKGWLPPPFDQGYTNAVFESLAMTNLNGMAIPTHCILSAYPWGYDCTNLDGTMKLGCQFEIQLTNLSSKVSVKQFKPEFPEGDVYMSDHRFESGPHYIESGQPYIASIHYSTHSYKASGAGTTGRGVPAWLTTNQVKQLPEYKNELAVAMRNGKEQAEADGMLWVQTSAGDRQA